MGSKKYNTKDNDTFLQTNFNNVVRSDEKRFTMDVTDRIAYHWIEKRCHERIFYRFHSGGCSLMTWGVFPLAGCSELCIVERRLNSARYLNILKNYLVSHPYFFYRGHYLNNLTFTQDGCTVHKSKIVHQRLQVMNIYLLPWPACSPD